MDVVFLKECLSYCEETGLFFWRVRPRHHFKSDASCKKWNNHYSGAKAGSVDSNGYVRISINGRSYKGHRLAVAISTGEFPKLLIDHKNLNPSDNRLSNLREATKSQNAANKSTVISSSGVKGVSWNSSSNSWQIRVSGKYVGRSKSLESAREMYFEAAKEKFGEFARRSL